MSSRGVHRAPRRIATGAPMLLAAAVTLVAPALAGASADSPVREARQGLRLTDQRLSFMRGVMATKWASRSPVEDLAQEATVLDGVRAAARERGLAPETVAAVFRREIAAAKEVQLGWGRLWLLHGFPADEPVPDLGQLRAQLSGLSNQIVATLERLGGLHCVPHVRAQLRRDSRRIIRTRFVTERLRAELVDDLIGVRSADGAGC